MDRGTHLLRALFVSNCQAKTSARDGWRPRGAPFTPSSQKWLFSGLLPRLLPSDRSQESGSGGGFPARSRGRPNEETSSPSPGLSHVCEDEEGTEGPLWRARIPHLKAGLIWAEVLSLSRGGTETPRWGHECRTPSCDPPERNFKNPKGLSTSTLVLTCFLKVMSAEGSRERGFFLPLYRGWFSFSAVIWLCSQYLQGPLS